MATTHDELKSFNRFATDKLADESTDLSMEELFDMWRVESPNTDLQAEDLAAVQAAIKDMESGDRGIPVEEHLREIREKFNLSTNE